MYFSCKEKYCKIAMILLCQVQGPLFICLFLYIFFILVSLLLLTIHCLWKVPGFYIHYIHHWKDVVIGRYVVGPLVLHIYEGRTKLLIKCRLSIENEIITIFFFWI